MRLDQKENDEPAPRPITAEARYDEATAHKAITLAARLQDQHRETMTVQQIEAIAAEVGVDPAFVRRSLEQMEQKAQAQLPKPPVQTGAPRVQVTTIQIDEKMVQQRLERTLEQLHKIDPRRWWAIAWMMMPIAGIFGGRREDTLVPLAMFAYVGIGIYLSSRQKDLEKQVAAGRQALVNNAAPTTGAPLTGSSEVSREALLEQLFQLQRQLEQTRVRRAFLSVDVVNSTGMKQKGSDLAVEFSFGQYRRWIEAIVKTEGGELQVAAGDGVMCIFTDDAAAVRAGQKLLTDLPRFNVEQNQLATSFRIRCGINAGEVACDPGTPIGFLQSAVIDRAAGLQKSAPENALAVSTNIDAGVRYSLADAEAIRDTATGEIAYVWQPRAV